MTDGAEAAGRYHQATKHSPEGVAGSGRALDWDNQPIPYKIYRTLEPSRLPTRVASTGVPAIRALLGGGEAGGGAGVPDLAAIARLCLLSNGVSRVRRYPGGELAFRAAGTTGALYHVELYLACTDLPDLPAGVYHFGAHDNALRRLRAGDHREALADASAGDPSVSQAPLVIVATSTFWRNAWKYGVRAWRHTFWDTGTVLANLLAVAAALRLPARLVVAFADAPVNALLDVDPRREASVCLVAVGQTDEAPPPAPPAPELELPTVPLSEREVRYPAIDEVQAATSLASSDEVAAWRQRLERLRLARPPPSAPLQQLAAPPPEAQPADPIERVIRRRGSARHFARQPISSEALGTLLEVAAAPLPADFGAIAQGMSDLFLIVNAVDGLEPGAYLRHADGLEQLRGGDLRATAGWLALGQDLAADAAVNLHWLADLERLLDALDGRGYRAAQLDAAIRAGRCWLAAYALGFGATGLTFFDDEVTHLFGSRAAGRAAMFLLAAGPR